MILGYGVDIVETDRIKRLALQWGDSFLKRIFTEKELSYSKKKKFSHQHLAARYAAKEAVLKAFGDRKNKLINWKDIEVKNVTSGRPVIDLKRSAKKLKNKLGIDDIILSISHTKDYAVAGAILLKGKGK